LQLQLVDMLDAIDRIATPARQQYWLAYGSALGAWRSSGFIPWDVDLDIYVRFSQYNDFTRLLEQLLPERYGVISADSCKDYDLLFSRVIRPDVKHQFLHVDIFPLVGTFGNARLARAHQWMLKVVWLLYWANRNQGRLADAEAAWRLRALGAIAAIIPKRGLKRLFLRLCRLIPDSSSALLLNPCGTYGGREIQRGSWFTDSMRVAFENIEVPVPAMCHEYLEHVYGDYRSIPSSEQIQSEIDAFREGRATSLAGIPVRLGPLDAGNV
jgi:lipopolysaccharide cholinephosphotransferase